jgi:hypothetical protein
MGLILESATTQTPGVSHRETDCSISERRRPKRIRRLFSSNSGNRFLWPCVQRSQYLPYGGAFVNVETLTARLRILLSVSSD